MFGVFQLISAPASGYVRSDAEERRLAQQRWSGLVARLEAKIELERQSVPIGNYTPRKTSAARWLNQLSENGRLEISIPHAFGYARQVALNTLHWLVGQMGQAPDGRPRLVLQEDDQGFHLTLHGVKVPEHKQILPSPAPPVARPSPIQPAPAPPTFNPSSPILLEYRQNIQTIFSSTYSIDEQKAELLELAQRVGPAHPREYGAYHAAYEALDALFPHATPNPPDANLRKLAGITIQHPNQVIDLLVYTPFLPVEVKINLLGQLKPSAAPQVEFDKAIVDQWLFLFGQRIGRPPPDLFGLQEIFFDSSATPLDSKSIMEQALRYYEFIETVAGIIKKEGVAPPQNRQELVEFWAHAGSIIWSNFSYQDRTSLIACMEPHLLDCDTSAIVVSDLLRAFNIPSALVQVPSHTLLQVSLSPKNQLYIETTYRSEFEFSILSQREMNSTYPRHYLQTLQSFPTAYSYFIRAAIRQDLGSDSTNSVEMSMDISEAKRLAPIFGQMVFVSRTSGGMP